MRLRGFLKGSGKGSVKVSRREWDLVSNYTYDYL